jgi:hypothetical protein
MTPPQQDSPEDLVHRLLTVIRGQFCADLTIKEWAQSQHFIRKNVILWPATFICKEHGFTLPAARYEAIMRGIFHDIIRNGQTCTVKYWPGYLMHCVQEHWMHHWVEYYDEAKSIRNLAERALLACKAIPAADKTVETLALAHKVLTHANRSRRPDRVRPAQKQLGLFGS